MFFEIGREATDLFALVFGRDGNQDGLVKTAADELDLTALNQRF
jgi:hypothetical protein